MSSGFKVVDLFAGPGGLAEGFASLRNEGGERQFEVLLSVEKEASAFKTLRLRSFYRQFETPPQAYYDYLAGRISRQDLEERHPEEWEKAVAETAMLELGTVEASAELDPKLDAIRRAAGDRVVLIGGPPCQAYSLVGRARNRGIKDYVAAEDNRHFLYREYIRIIERLQPVAFVMENVKGMLSARVDGERMIERIMSDLQMAGGRKQQYTIVPLTVDDRGSHPGHVIRAEEYGIPQRRHRVILMGIRIDKRSTAETDSQPVLEEIASVSTVAGVLRGMPVLRSGLSKRTDGPADWREEATRAFRKAEKACVGDRELADVAARLAEVAEGVALSADLPRSDRRMSSPKDNRLASWLVDKQLETLPNHESRGHMASDLARYAFASVFAEIRGTSPKADQFPVGLAPAHQNWTSGKFADRFRVQVWDQPATTITSHISKDGHYFIHPDPFQCRSLTVREAARLQTFPDNYLFEGNRTEQYVQVGNAVPPLLARQIAQVLATMLEG